MTPKSACPPLRTLWPSCRSFLGSFFALSNSKRGNCSLSELQCWAETADHKPDRQSSKEMGEENSLDLRQTHGAGRADGRVPLAQEARQGQDAKWQRGAQGGVTFLGYVQVTWVCPPTLWKAQPSPVQPGQQRLHRGCQEAVCQVVYSHST